MPKKKPDFDKRTIEVIEEMINRFANGEKLMNLFKEYKTDRVTFNDDVKRFDIYPKYARAREEHGDGFNDEIETIKQDLKDGKIEDKVARVLIDTIKWQASKFYPKMYGERIDITSKDQKIGSPDFSGFSTEELRAYLDKMSGKE
ncbi:MAG: hypothetical protein ABIJ40_03595 [Bacteroidota bacterium]